MSFVRLTQILDGFATCPTLINLDKVRDVTPGGLGNRVWVRLDGGELMVVEGTLDSVFDAIRAAQSGVRSFSEVVNSISGGGQ